MSYLKQKSPVQILEEVSYFTLAYCQLIFAIMLRKEILIIYQMGAVGSMTILKSLRASGFDGLIYHTHFLTEEGLKDLEKIKYKSYGSWYRLPWITKRHILQSRFLQYQLTKGSLKHQNIKVLTLVRDPVARQISRFFQNYRIWCVEFESSDDKVTYLEQKFASFFIEYSSEATFTWFDRELKKMLDIDVFLSKFPQTQGYKILVEGLTTVLLLKLESLHDCGHSALQEFLGIDKLSICESNSSNSKEYANVYHFFLNSVDIKESYLNRIYQSHFSQHFYTAEEIQELKLKWEKVFK